MIDDDALGPGTLPGITYTLERRIAMLDAALTGLHMDLELLADRVTALETREGTL